MVIITAFLAAFLIYVIIRWVDNNKYLIGKIDKMKDELNKSESEKNNYKIIVKEEIQRNERLKKEISDLIKELKKQKNRFKNLSSDYSKLKLENRNMKIRGLK